MIRTVVKANYVRAGGGASAIASATMRASAQYYGHRPDADGAHQYRLGFDAERDEIGKEEAYRHAEQGKGDYAYRIVLSPGEELDREELREWTRDVMQGVEEAGGSWIGFVHEDHTDNAHAHVIAFTRERLEHEDFRQMREEGDRSAEVRLEARAQMEQDPMQEETAGRDQEREPVAQGRDQREQEARASERVSERRGSEMEASRGE
ncbi:MAG TPA: relaxase/mobilization nuclease domain-containing protein [Rubrobacteraceae bacterium]|nr:relaxase/mobilization nuclease domain-containing protein [Rubrobacteraceae bacterium]